ncbi:MAG: hypothetical protein ABIR05_00655 [Luteimonas sp.]
MNIVRLHPDSAGQRDEGHARARIFGEEANSLYPGQAWDDVEPHMAGDWRQVRGDSGLSWEQVRAQARAAWLVAQLHSDDRLRDNAPVRLQA